MSGDLIALQFNLLGQTRRLAFRDRQGLGWCSLSNGAIDGGNLLQIGKQLRPYRSHHRQTVDRCLSQFVGDQQQAVFEDKVLVSSKAEVLAGLQLEHHHAVFHELVVFGQKHHL